MLLGPFKSRGGRLACSTFVGGVHPEGSDDGMMMMILFVCAFLPWLARSGHKKFNSKMLAGIYKL
jgi:hypothetical protein